MDTLTYGALSGKLGEVESEVEELKSATRWIGVTTTALTDGATTKPIVIDGSNVNQRRGDVTSYNEIEFVWNGSKWQEFGGNNSGIFKVIVRWDNGYSADKTFSEILNAINNNYFVYLLYIKHEFGIDRFVFYTLDLYSNDEIRFVSSSNYDISILRYEETGYSYIYHQFVITSSGNITSSTTGTNYPGKYFIPTCNSSDSGKVLMVNSNGAPVWTALPSASGVSF